jgi:predicted nucleic acid-binding protein
MPRVFADTNVLFPFSVMDLLFALSEDGVHEVIWTEALLDEWAEVIVRTHHRSAEAAAIITAAIREFIPESEVERSSYVHLIAEMPGKDADDHEHIAAAIAGGASVLLTHNTKDFPTKPLAALGLRVLHPDTYLCELADEIPVEVTETVIRLAAEKRRPPKTPSDLATDLSNAGVPRFADKVRSLLAAASD